MACVKIAHYQSLLDTEIVGTLGEKLIFTTGEDREMEGGWEKEREQLGLEVPSIACATRKKHLNPRYTPQAQAAFLTRTLLSKMYQNLLLLCETVTVKVVRLD